MLLEASSALTDVRKTSFAVLEELFPAVVLSFDLTAFSAAAFELAGIERPPSIAHSVIKRQAEFYFGRVAAKLALAAHGCAGASIGIGAMRAPVWPAGILGSISHTDGFAAAMVVGQAAWQGIGVDIERVVDVARCESIADLVTDRDERSLLAALAPHMSPEAALTLAFSAKESFFKGVCAEVGRYFDFTAVRIREIDVATRCLRMVVREPLSARLMPGREFSLRYEFIQPDLLLSFFIW